MTGPAAAEWVAPARPRDVWSRSPAPSAARRRGHPARWTDRGAGRCPRSGGIAAGEAEQPPRARTRSWLPRPLAAAAIVALWVPYTVVNTAYPGPLATYTAGLVLALAAAGLLTLAGPPPARCVLALVRPLACLAALRRAPVTAVAAATLVLLLDRGTTADWLFVLAYAPASALAQELYFRGALLTVLQHVWSPRAGVALQALLFAGWHGRAFLEAPPLPAAAFVAGTFGAGLLWGSRARIGAEGLADAVRQHTLTLLAWDALLLWQGQSLAPLE